MICFGVLESTSAESTSVLRDLINSVVGSPTGGEERRLMSTWSRAERTAER